METNIESKVPNAVKMFVWRVCNDLLPTKENILKKDSLCPIYSLEGESVEHILWSCSSARDVWGA